MYLFNAIQIVVLFAAWPFLLSWLESQHWSGAHALFYIAWCAYIIAFVGMISSVWESLTRWKW